jgi:hypothetical protein
MERTDYEAKTVPDLREEAGNRGLSTDGLKAELVDRLVAHDEQRAALEAQTVPEIQDQLRDADLPVSGAKDELVDRLVEADQNEVPEVRGARAQREVQAGGHIILVDEDPETPAPMDSCSICGARYGECVHTDEDHGKTWAIADPGTPPPASETHWPDETVGAASLYPEPTPDADVKAAEDISEATEEE